MGGLALGYYFPVDARRPTNEPGKPPGPKPVAGSQAHEAPGRRASTPTSSSTSAPDGIVTIVCHRSEMGQGIRSSLPVLIADELGAQMARVKIVQADGDKAYGDQNTDGSNSIRGIYEDMRSVGRHGAHDAGRRRREALERQRRRTASRGITWSRISPTGRTLGFGELALEAGKLKVPERRPSRCGRTRSCTHLGKALPLLDGARVRDRPGDLRRRRDAAGDAHRGDRAAAGRRREGRALRRDASARGPGRPQSDRDARAEAALRLPALGRGRRGRRPHLGGDARPRRARRDMGPRPNGSYDSTKYREVLAKAVRGARERSRARSAMSESALKSAARVVEAEYHVPHLPHVPMEPPVAVARVERQALRGVGADAEPAGRADRGGAGARHAARQGHASTSRCSAAASGASRKPTSARRRRCSRARCGAPVRVQWTREDDVRHDYFNAVSTQPADARASTPAAAWSRGAIAPRSRPIAQRLRRAGEARHRRSAAGRAGSRARGPQRVARKSARRRRTRASAGCDRSTTSFTRSRSARSSTRSRRRRRRDPRDVLARAHRPAAQDVAV